MTNSLVAAGKKSFVAPFRQFSHALVGFMGDGARLANLTPEVFDLGPQPLAALNRGLILIIGHEALNLMCSGMFRDENAESSC